MRIWTPLSYRPPALGRPRNRSTVIAALLVATLTFAGELAGGFHGERPSLSAARANRPTDQTVHVEVGTATEPDTCFGCLGCLSQQRQLAVPTSAPVPGAFEPDASAVSGESTLGLASDAHRLTPSRAPPLA